MNAESIDSRLLDLQSAVYPHYPESFRRILSKLADRIKGMDILQASTYVLAECNTHVTLYGNAPSAESTIFIANHPSWFLDVPSFVG